MQRGAVRSGRFDQRDRATQRRRSRSRISSRDDASSAELEALIAQATADCVTVDDWERVDWRAVLTRTTSCPQSEAERLRRLAIVAEFHVGYIQGRRGWHALRRLYRAAEGIDPDDSWLADSAAVSAHTCALSQRDDALHDALLDEGRRSALRAIALAPAESHHHYVLGLIAHHRRPPRHAEALEAYEEACRSDPHDGWAQLYRAYCLDEMSRWEEALVAYRAIPRAGFVGQQAWRNISIDENEMWCLWQVGLRQATAQSAEALLGQLERQPHLLVHLHVWGLIQLARGPFHDLLFARLRALASGGHGGRWIVDALDEEEETQDG